MRLSTIAPEQIDTLALDTIADDTWPDFGPTFYLRTVFRIADRLPSQHTVHTADDLLARQQLAADALQRLIAVGEVVRGETYDTVTIA